jgi:hypothetical protein
VAAADDAAAGVVGDRVHLGVPRQDRRRREARACGIAGRMPNKRLE